MWHPRKSVGQRRDHQVVYWIKPMVSPHVGEVVWLAGSNERAEAITWATRLREDLNFLIDDFSKAYQSANPK
jgi:aromatic ring-cleaving dioxygenase